MTSFARSRSSSAEINCSLDDNRKEEEVEEEDYVVAAKFSGIVRHMQGDTGTPAVTSGIHVQSISASKRLLQRPSQPPPPPPCPSGDNVEEDIAAGEPGQFVVPSPEQMTELHLYLQQQQQQQQPRYKHRPGHRSPVRQTAKIPQSLQLKDKKYEYEKGKSQTYVSARSHATMVLKLRL